MKFAIWDTTGYRKGCAVGDIYRQHLEEAELADAIGIAHYWFFEHHLSPTAPMPAPNLMIAQAAQRTKRMRLGNMVNVLPYHNPLLVAEQAAMLDNMTGGRLDIGIGRGGKGSEYATFCLDPANSRKMFFESIEVLLRIWADEQFTHHGQFFHVHKADALSPPLIQTPHPRIFVTANSEESLRFAAGKDFSFVQLDSLIDDCRRDQDFYRAIQVASGFAARPRLCLTREVYVAPTDAEAQSAAKQHLLEHWNLWGRFTQFVQQGQVPASFESWYQRAPRLFAMSYEELLESGMAIAGSPETVARQIRRHRDELDLEALVCAFQLGSMPHDMVMRSMKLFGEEVMPRVAATAREAAE